MNDDWRYSPERMKLRQEVLKILLHRFCSHIKEDGTPEHSAESVYACAHDWVSQGHITSSGVVKYYEAYYQ